MMIEALFLVLSMAIQELTNDVPGSTQFLDRLWQAHLDAGQTDATRVRIIEYLAASSREGFEDPRFLLQSSLVLARLGEDEESERIFDLVPDDDLDEPYQILNRLQVVVDEDLGRTEGLARRLGEHDTDALARWIHDSFAKRLAPRPRPGFDLEECAELIDDLCSEDDGTKWCAGGLRDWLTFLASDRGPVATNRALASLRSTAPAPYVERYALLIADEASAHAETQLEAELALFESIGVFQRTIPLLGRSERDRERRARERYLLALACSRVAERYCAPASDRAVAWFLRAAHSAPDGSDADLSWASFYERACTGGPADVREHVAARLAEAGRHGDARTVWLDLVLARPCEIGAVRRRLLESEPERDFADDLTRHITAHADDVPTIELRALDGGTTSLRDFGERWILLEFWGTWCAPCREGLPEVEALHREFELRGSEGPLLLAIACRDDDATVDRFMNEHGYTFPVSMGDEAAVAAFDVSGFPTRILVTPDGKCLRFAFDGADWTESVRAFVELGR